MQGSSISVRASAALLALFVWPAAAHAQESAVRVTSTSPAYAATIDALDDIIITVHFSHAMDPSIQADFVLDQRGATDENGDPLEIPGKLTWPDAKTLQFRPTQRLRPRSTYQVTLFSLIAQDGREGDAPFRTVFTTGAETDAPASGETK
jgi:hypothetical protein